MEEQLYLKEKGFGEDSQTIADVDTYLLGLSRTELLGTMGGVIGVTPATMRRRYYNLDYHDHPTSLHILNDYAAIESLISPYGLDVEDVIVKVKQAFADEATIAETIRSINEVRSSDDEDSIKDVITLVLPKLQRILYDVVGNRRDQAVLNLVRVMEMLDKYV